MPDGPNIVMGAGTLSRGWGRRQRDRDVCEETAAEETVTSGMATLS